MTVTNRSALAAAIGLPLAVMTLYLLWVWPRPAGSSIVAQMAPYALSLLTGVPFVLLLVRRSGRAWILLLYLAGGFALLWILALVVLCGVRGVCL